MASTHDIYGVHGNLTILSGVGSITALFGMASYFMSYEYKDFDRVKLDKGEKMKKAAKKRKRISKIIAVVALLLYIAGLIIIVLSIGLYRDQKEEMATNISALIQQIRNQTTSIHNTNEPVILASLSTVVLLLGAVQGIRNFNKTENFGWIATILYTGGWLGNGFAASMGTNSISSIENARLAWTLPGVVGITAGTMMIPWQIKHQYISGPAFPLTALGYLLFSIGNVSVLNPAEFTT